MKKQSFCKMCGQVTKEYGRLFCGTECHRKSRKGVYPAHLKRPEQPRDIKDMQDGSVDAGLLLMSMIPRPGGGEWTTAEVGEVCGVTGQYIRMLERSALRKLRAGFMERVGPQVLANLGL